MLRRTLAAVVAAAALAWPAGAQDAYLIGVTGAMTGPAAGTNGPPIEGLRLYVDRLNAAGGINGKKIQLTVLDDQGEPSKAAADLLQFWTTAYAGGYDCRATLAFIMESAKEPVRIGFAAMAIPLSRGEIDYAEEQAKAMGMTPVDKEVIPPPTADYTPFATKLKDANPNWIFSWAPWVTQVKTFEALRRLGWEGDYITWAHIEAESELARLKDGKFYVIGANSLFQDNLPIHKQIGEEAKKGNVRYPAEQLTEGWIGGLVLEAVLKGAGWPADAAKIRAAMENIKVDTQGLRGGPIEWSKENHFRTRQYYRIYRWDPAKSAVTVTKDWVAYDVK